MDKEVFKEMLRCINGYLNEGDYTQGDFAEDILSVMEFLASDEVARFSEGSELQLSMLQTALLNYVDSLNCFDVAQED